jgi:hypothetical protein
LRACAAASVVPLWSAHHLPFTDLPQHVAMIAALRHWFDPAWKAQEYFTLALGRASNALYAVVGALLAFPFGTAERANLVLLSAVAIAFPYSLRSLLRALRGDERLALFACTLFWNQSLLIGFLPYLAALPLLNWVLALAVRQSEAPVRRRALLLGALAVAIFALHLSAFLFFVPAAIACSWGLPAPEGDESPLRALARRVPHLPGRLLWLAPAGALAAAWLARSSVMHPETAGWSEPLRLRFEGPSAALRSLPGALLDIWRGLGDEGCLLALVAAAALLAWARPAGPEEPASPWRRGVVVFWVALAAALYLGMPRSAGWLDYLNERYAIVAALLAPALLRPARGLRGAAPLLVVAGTALFAGGNALWQVRAFEEEVGPFDEVLSAAAPGRRLLSLVFDQNSGHAKFSPFLHFGSYYRARGGAIASFSFAELPQSPLRYRPERAPPPMPPGWEWRPWTFRNDREGAYYDYVLVRGPVDPFARAPPGPRWRVAARGGSWTLYEKVGP